MRTELLATDSPGDLAVAVDRAVDLLAAGEPVALPTETVYGLAADAMSSQAVAKIFEAKERPFFDPLIVHLPDRGWMDRLTTSRPPVADALVERFWPGPLTLVLPRAGIVPDLVTSGLPTVALRMSAHPVFAAVVGRLGRPLAAPSANPFGRISPTTARHVVDGLGGRIPLVIDGGPCAMGVESTVVAVEAGRLCILRAGPVTPEELAPFGPVEFAAAGALPHAPGQLKSHYAPRTPLRLADLPEAAGAAGTLRAGLLAWQAPPSGGNFAAVEVLSPSGDLREGAAGLFAKLRRLDEAGLDVIYAEPVPEHGLGLAIMDRLRKAAAHV